MEHSRAQHGNGAKTGVGCTACSEANRADEPAATNNGWRCFSIEDRSADFPVSAPARPNLGSEKILPAMSHTISEAVILMAGSGSRLRSAGQNCLKPLLPLLERPLISYTLDTLAKAGIKTIYAVVGFERHALRAHVNPLIPPNINV